MGIRPLAADVPAPLVLCALNMSTSTPACLMTDTTHLARVLGPTALCGGLELTKNVCPLPASVSGALPSAYHIL